MEWHIVIATTEVYQLDMSWMKMLTSKERIFDDVGAVRRRTWMWLARLMIRADR